MLGLHFSLRPWGSSYSHTCPCKPLSLIFMFGNDCLLIVCVFRIRLYHNSPIRQLASATPVKHVIVSSHRTVSLAQTVKTCVPSEGLRVYRTHPRSYQLCQRQDYRAPIPQYRQSRLLCQFAVSDGSHRPFPCTFL